MSDGFSLDDALSGQSSAHNVQSGQGQNQNWNNPWGGQNPGQQNPGFPGQGQPYPGFPGPGQGQQNPGYPGPAQGQQYPGFPGPGQGQQNPGPGQGQQYPGFPGQGQGQQYPGFPGQGQGQQFPGYPAFPGPGQSYPGAPTPGQAGQQVPSVPSGPKKVPFDIPLPSGCTKGMVLTLNAVPTGKRFGIDYKEGNDIVFHFNPRFDENPHVIVRNSMIRGKWGAEERQCPKFPFVQGQPFQLQILFEPDCYKVAVNNENICQYKHRVQNFSKINNICIGGDLTISDTSLYTM